MKDRLDFRRRMRELIGKNMDARQEILKVDEMDQVGGLTAAEQARTIDSINELTESIHQMAKAKGFWDRDERVRNLIHSGKAALGHLMAAGGSAGVIPFLKRDLEQAEATPVRNYGEALALIMSEACEGLEALRNGNGPSDHIPEFSLIEEELADVIIRTLDLAAGLNARIGEAIMAKIEFNAVRPHKHGKEF
ncbi:MAG: hypothetical protein ABFD89_01550 [Bryobacteraceae bacterium]